MKKVIAYLIITVMMISLSACGKVENTYFSSNLDDSSDIYDVSSYLSSEAPLSSLTSQFPANASSNPDITSSKPTTSSKWMTTVSSAVSPTVPAAQVIPQASADDYMKAVWISYYDYRFRNLSYNKFKAAVDEMFNNAVRAELNTVIVHVRANSDSLYKSDYFPWAEAFTGTQGKDPGYDPLNYMVAAAHARGLKIHAWINPYRVSNNSSDVNTLAVNNPARIIATDQDPSNDNWVIPYNNKIYFNPAIPEVQQLIINGVREIVEKYAVDGIQFDDYFYPTTAADFDASTYSAYAASCASPLSLTEWRIANVSTLVAGVWRVTHARGVPFGISPAAHIGENAVYKDGYADVFSWMSTSGYIDYIAPQLYFGFEYPSNNYKFDVLLSNWKAATRHSNVKLYIGLAAYKIGTIDINNEWIEHNDIIAREAALVKQTGCNGIIVFSCSSLFSQNQQNKAELEALINVIK